VWICHYYCCHSLIALKKITIPASTTAAGPATAATAAPTPVATAAVAAAAA